MEQHQDEHITCAECGTTFVFTAAEADSFATKGLEPPKRCFECRRARKAQRAGGPREGHRGPHGGDANGYRSPMPDPAWSRDGRPSSPRGENRDQGARTPRAHDDRRGPGRGGPPFRDRHSPSHPHEHRAPRDDRGPRSGEYRAPAFRDDRGPRNDEYRAPGFRDDRGPRNDEYRAPGFRDDRGPRNDDRDAHADAYRAPAFQSDRGPRSGEYRAPGFRDNRGPRGGEYRAPAFQNDRGPRGGEYRAPGFRDNRGPRGGEYRAPAFQNDRGPGRGPRRGPEHDARQPFPGDGAHGRGKHGPRAPHAHGDAVPSSQERTPRKPHAERPSFPITCAQCGAASEVPFKPLEGREILCRECYRARKESAA